MPALKFRFAEPFAPDAPDVVTVAGAAHLPQSSAPRELRDLLETRLAPGHREQAKAHRLSPLVRLCIVGLLGGLAWSPIAAALYVFS